MLSIEPAGYTYKAELLCPNCTIEALKGESRAELYDSSDEATIRILANRAGVDYSEPRSYDSSDFPKPVLDIDLECGFDVDGHRDDSVHERCGACNRTLCGV